MLVKVNDKLHLLCHNHGNNLLCMSTMYALRKGSNLCLNFHYCGDVAKGGPVKVQILPH